MAQLEDQRPEKQVPVEMMQVEMSLVLVLFRNSVVRSAALGHRLRACELHRGLCNVGAPRSAGSW